MDVMTKEEKARQRSAEWYAANREVCKSRSAARYEANKEKRKMQAAAWYQKNKARRYETARIWQLANKAKFRALGKKWIKENPERLKQLRAKYFLRDRDKRNAESAAYRANNPAKFKAIKAASRAKHPETDAEAGARRRTISKQATPKWANKFFMAEAYRLAALRAKTLGYPWHVDHIVPLNHKLVCGLHTHDNLRVVPATENLRKHNSFDADSCHTQQAWMS